MLARYGKAALPGLIAALKHESLRAQTALVLRRMGRAAAPAVGPLVDALPDAGPTARREILFALAAIGPAAKPAAPALAKLLATDDDDRPSVGPQPNGIGACPARPR